MSVPSRLGNQGRSGLGLEAQQATVREHLTSVGGVDLVPGRFIEVETGKRNDRPKLQQAILRCQQSGATLIIAKLDRLGTRRS
jgi:DNA invertase Pin-like site-specific DNA recombinase